MTTTTPTAAAASAKPAIVPILRRGAIATVIATVVNALLFIVGSTFTFPATAITPMGVPVPLGAVIGLTIAPGIAATVGYIILTRLLSVRNSRIAAWAVTVLMLVLMAGGPFGIIGAPVAEIVILEIMHLVAALVPVGALTRD